MALSTMTKYISSFLFVTTYPDGRKEDLWWMRHTARVDLDAMTADGRKEFAQTHGVSPTEAFRLVRLHGASGQDRNIAI